MGGIGNIAMAAAAIAVASIAYAIFQQVWTLIPWAGSAMMGASWALMFSGIDPILGMGGAIGLGAFIYPALQIFTAHTTRTYRNPMAMPTANNAVKSLRTTGAIMATGIVAGVGHLVTKNVPGSLIAGAAAGYLMSKYGSSALINFYIEIGFMQELACGASGSDPKNCVTPCNKTTLAADWDVFKKANPMCQSQNAPANIQSWCGSWKDYLSKCGYDRINATQPSPVQPGTGGGGRPAGTGCQQLAAYQVMGPPTWSPGICKPKKIAYGYSNGQPDMLDFSIPLSKADFDYYREGRDFGIEWAPGDMGLARATKGQPPRFSYVFGNFRPNAEWTCMWKNNNKNDQSTAYLYDDQTAVNSQSVIGEYSYQPIDLTNKMNRTALNSLPGGAAVIKHFGQQTVCIPSNVDPLGNFNPIPNLDAQPSDANRGKYCKGKGTAPWKVPHVQPVDDKSYQCQSGPLTKPGSYVPWPKV